MKPTAMIALALTLVLDAGAANAQAQPDRFDKPAALGVARIRYMVTDIQGSVAFYAGKLGFKLVAQSGPFFALLTRGDVQLLLSPVKGPGGASQPMPNGQRPAPGGWNRIVLYVPDLQAEVDRLRSQGVHFRNGIVHGLGGNEILLEDPSGNPVELFQPG
ncbi:VOC family protein [Phenylobacterium sp.]|uniref:VOC family protein n=1 Tax=Phenylobacterium sp. TaxID=1871053 RepID=UPI002DE8E8C3|nr:VOC family protein [Phenylobacterium sp.]